MYMCIYIYIHIYIYIYYSIERLMVALLAYNQVDYALW